MGATDNGDLGGAASALPPPHLKRNTIIWQGQKSHASGALWGRLALLWPPPPLFDTEDYKKWPKMEGDRFFCLRNRLVGVWGRSPRS